MKIVALGIAGSLCLGLFCTAWPRLAEACSPMGSDDWMYNFTWPSDGETEVGTNMRPVIWLERSGGDEGISAATVDSSDLQVICDGTDVPGTWDAEAHIFRYDGIRRDSDGRWWDSNGCSWCESTRVIAELQFVPDAPLPSGAQCQIVLYAPCRYPADGQVCWFEPRHDYPWAIVAFTTGAGPMVTPPPTPVVTPAPVRYQYEHRECGYDGVSTCSVCITQWTERRFGVGMLLPEPLLSGWQRYHLTVADSVESFATGDVLIQTVLDQFVDPPLALGFPLGALGDHRTYCVQLQVEDRYGNLSAPSAPVCVSPDQLPTEGCSCSAAPGHATTLLLGLLVLLGLWRRLRLGDRVMLARALRLYFKLTVKR